MRFMIMVLTTKEADEAGRLPTGEELAANPPARNRGVWAEAPDFRETNGPSFAMAGRGRHLPAWCS